MISVVAFCQDHTLENTLQRYVQAYPEFHLAECTARISVAVQAITALAPDLVLCEDPTSDGQDALSLLQATAAWSPSTCFLICGIPHDFDLLLKLLQAGAGGAIPAPWSEENLYGALDRFQASCTLRRQESGAVHDRRLRRVLDKRFFEDTIVTSAASAILLNLPAIDYEYQIDFTPGCFQVLNILIDPRPRELLNADAFLPMLDLEDLARSFFAPHCHTMVCYVKDRGLTLLLNSAEAIPDLRTLCRSFLTECGRTFTWLFGPNTISIGLGLPVSSAADIPSAVETAKFAGWLRLSEGRNRILDYALYESSWQTKHSYLPEGTAETLRQSVQALDSDACLTAIAQALQQAHNAGEMMAIALSVNDVLIEAFSDGDTGLVENSKYLQFAKNMPPMVEDLDSADTIRQEIQKWAGNCFLQLKSRTGGSEDAAISAARQYMSVHYAEKLRLEDIAEQVHLTPSYFCMKFHQATGQTCVEYLTALRMERAKDLLQHTALKIYEIAEAVGFSDTRHFSRTFRRCFGVLPTAFRSGSRQTEPSAVRPPETEDSAG